MAANGHQYGYYCCRQEPPFFPAFVKAQAQHEEEDGNSAHIHGPSREWLGAPVERQRLCGFTEVLLAVFLKEFYGLRLIRIHGAG